MQNQFQTALVKMFKSICKVIFCKPVIANVVRNAEINLVVVWRYISSLIILNLNTILIATYKHGKWELPLYIINNTY